MSEPNHHTTKLFPENLVAIEMKKTEILINQPVSLGLSILELSKILMYESWYDNVKLKKGEKVKWRYMDTDSLIVYIKQKICTKMLKLEFILQIMNQNAIPLINHYQKEKVKK